MTKLLIYLILIKVVSWGSKPTVWDGDILATGLSVGATSGSKPTVWDGDYSFYISKTTDKEVLSPLCGMETSRKKRKLSWLRLWF